MQRDVLSISKDILNFFKFNQKQLEFIEDKMYWLHDHLLDQWVLINGVGHLYNCNDRFSGGFISDEILHAFVQSETQEEADEKLNYLLLQLCEEGYGI